MALSDGGTRLALPPRRSSSRRSTPKIARATPRSYGERAANDIRDSNDMCSARNSVLCLPSAGAQENETGLPPRVKWTFNFDAGWGSFDRPRIR